jgi:hypothetical protein
MDRSKRECRGGSSSLSETGYAEGRNLAVEYRWAEYRLERLTRVTGLKRQA